MHDPHIGNEENQSYLLMFSQKYDIKPFQNHEEAINFLKKTEEHWFLITSGANGKLLVPMIHHIIQ